MVQPFKVMYTKPPSEVAVQNFSGYNIQLPRLLEMDPNFDDDLYCWCYALYTAHLEKKTIQEVVSMTPGLQAFAKRDVGFQQFCDRYETVSTNPEARREYAMWFDEALREKGMLDWARQEVRDEYEPRLADAEQQLAQIKRKLDESEQQRMEAAQERKAELLSAAQERKAELLSVARVMKDEGMAIATIAKALPLSVSEIEEL